MTVRGMIQTIASVYVLYVNFFGKFIGVLEYGQFSGH